MGEGSVRTGTVQVAQAVGWEGAGDREGGGWAEVPKCPGNPGIGLGDCGRGGWAVRLL